MSSSSLFSEAASSGLEGLHHIQNGTAPAMQYDTYRGIMCGWHQEEDVPFQGH